jgi:hypothetical protein
LAKILLIIQVIVLNLIVSWMFYTIFHDCLCTYKAQKMYEKKMLKEFELNQKREKTYEAMDED